jgi:hypothetical protein
VRLPFFHGWIVIAVAFVTKALGVNARTSFSLFFPPSLDEFGWDARERLYTMSGAQGLVRPRSTAPSRRKSSRADTTARSRHALARVDAGWRAGPVGRRRDLRPDRAYTAAFWLGIGASVVSAIALRLASPRRVRAVAGRIPGAA